MLSVFFPSCYTLLLPNSWFFLSFLSLHSSSKYFSSCFRLLVTFFFLPPSFLTFLPSACFLLSLYFFPLSSFLFYRSSSGRTSVSAPVHTHERLLPVLDPTISQSRNLYPIPNTPIPQYQYPIPKTQSKTQKHQKTKTQNPKPEAQGAKASIPSSRIVFFDFWRPES